MVSASPSGGSKVPAGFTVLLGTGPNLASWCHLVPALLPPLLPTSISYIPAVLNCGSYQNRPCVLTFGLLLYGFPPSWYSLSLILHGIHALSLGSSTGSPHPSLVRSPVMWSLPLCDSPSASFVTICLSVFPIQHKILEGAPMSYWSS